MTVYYLTKLDYKLFETLAKYRNILVEGPIEAIKFLEKYNVLKILSNKAFEYIKQGDGIAIEINGKVFIFWLGAYR